MCGLHDASAVHALLLWINRDVGPFSWTQIRSTDVTIQPGFLSNPVDDTVTWDPPENPAGSLPRGPDLDAPDIESDKLQMFFFFSFYFIFAQFLFRAQNPFRMCVGIPGASQDSDREGWQPLWQPNN